MKDRINFRVSFLVFFLLWVGSECSLRIFKGSVWIRAGCRELVSPQLLQDRLKALHALPGKKLLLLGDSVFYGSALREKGLPDWQKATVPAAFRQDPRWKSWQILDFSGDGLNPMDLDALLLATQDLRPDAVVIELNYRMLAEKAGQGPDIMAHPWLGAWLEAGLRRKLEADRPSSGIDGRLRDAMVGFLRAWSCLFRYAELEGTVMLSPSARGVAGKVVAGIFPTQDHADENDALLDFKIRPYYEAPVAGPEHAAFAALDDMNAFIKSRGIPALIFLTPQNRSRILDFLDEKSFRSNRALIKKSFSAAAYRDWADERPGGQFLDHCHWDAQGNLALERKITEVLRAPCQLP